MRFGGVREADPSLLIDLTAGRDEGSLRGLWTTASEGIEAMPEPGMVLFGRPSGSRFT